MSSPDHPRGFLMNFAAEGMAPFIGGCAGALAGGPVGGVAGVVVGQVIERAINCFGKHIVERWAGWMRGQPRNEQLKALAELAELPPARARQQAEAALELAAPQAAPDYRAIALEYLCAIPRSVYRSMVLDQRTGGRTLLPTQAPDDPRLLMSLLPTDVPPYPPNTNLPGTQYRLTDLLGTGGFGAVYKATAPTLQHLNFAL